MTQKSPGDDIELVERAKRCDNTALAELIDRHWETVETGFRRACERVRTLLERGDLPGMVWERILGDGKHHLQGWRSQKPFPAFLATCARNAVADENRKSLRQGVSLALEDLDDEPAPEAMIASTGHLPARDEAYGELLKAEQVEAIKQALTELPDRQRQILLMRCPLEDDDPPLPFGAIAEHFRISSGNARVEYSRALGRLRKAMAEEFPEP